MSAQLLICKFAAFTCVSFSFTDASPLHSSYHPIKSFAVVIQRNLFINQTFLLDILYK